MVCVEGVVCNHPSITGNELAIYAVLLGGENTCVGREVLKSTELAV